VIKDFKINGTKFQNFFISKVGKDILENLKNVGSIGTIT